MQLQTVKIKSLKSHGKNYNQHPASQVSELKKSLDMYGQVKNIVVWQNQVIAGNGLLAAAKKQGLKEIEIQDVSEWDEEKAISFMIADNQLAMMAIANDDMLAELLKDLEEPLEIPGIDEDFLDSLDFGGEEKEKEGGGSVEIENNYAEQFGIIVMCDSEEHQETVYNFLNGKGYKCKVVNT